MSVLSDKTIRKLALEDSMISPFVDKQVRDGKIYKCAPIAYLPFALKNTKQLDTKYWKPYLDYTPASLDNDDELEQFFLTHKKPESICSMCPSSPKYYEKYDRKIK